VLLGRDGAAHPLLSPHRPILLEGARPLDRRLVDARGLVYLEGALIDGEVSFGGPGLVGREVGVGLEDVVFDQGVAGPAVDGEVAGARCVVGSGVFDCSGGVSEDTCLVMGREGQGGDSENGRGDIDKKGEVPSPGAFPSLAADKAAFAVPVG